jgi:hypothetical protein
MFAVSNKYGNAKVIGLDSYDGWKGLGEFLYVK